MANATLNGILNGILHAAAIANPPDQSTMGLVEQMYQMSARWGSTYDAAVTTTTVYLGGVGGATFDTMQSTIAQNAGITAAQLGA